MNYNYSSKPMTSYYYYTPNYNNDNRLAPGIGGFLVPFGLGFLTGPLVFNNRPPRPPRPYYGYNPYFYPRFY